MEKGEIKEKKINRMEDSRLAMAEVWLRNQGFDCIGCGHTRSVWARNDDSYVIKMPLLPVFEEYNCRESVLWATLKDDRQAPCKIFDVYGIKLLMMERVEVLCDPSTGKGFNDMDLPKKDMPEWTHEVDMCQVGFLNGKIVAYDYPDSPLFIEEARDRGVNVPYEEVEVSVDEMLSLI